MASKGAYARGTDGSDHAYRQRVVDRYTSLVVARRRVRGVLFVSGTIAALFAACTVLSAYAHRDGSVRRALDPRTTAIVVSGCLGAMLSVHGAWAIKRSATTRGATLDVRDEDVRVGERCARRGARSGRVVL